MYCACWYSGLLSNISRLHTVLDRVACAGHVEAVGILADEVCSKEAAVAASHHSHTRSVPTGMCAPTVAPGRKGICLRCSDAWLAD